MVRREEEEIEIRLPEFDEKEFLLEETKAAKITYITLLLATLSGVITGLIGQATWPKEVYGVIFGLAFATFIPTLFRMFKINPKEVSGKRWAEAYGIYFITWFVLWVLLLNPPFFDAVEPKITAGIFQTGGVPFTEVAPLSSQNIYRLESDGNYSLLIKAADNWRVDRIEVSLDNRTLTLNKLTSDDVDLYNLTTFKEKWERHGGEYYSVSLGPLTPGTREVVIVAKDPKGNVAKVVLSVNFV